MTSSGPQPISQDQKLGPGRLVVVVGPSGAGKDTLIGHVKAACRDNADVVFLKRIVTREASSSEDNDCMSEADFHRCADNGDFAVHWNAHSLQYALPLSLVENIRKGRTVVTNVSRTIVSRLRQSYRNVSVVLVSAPPEVLAARLAARGRATDGNIGARLGRRIENIEPDVVIYNVGPPEQHGRELLDVVCPEQAKACS